MSRRKSAGAFEDPRFPPLAKSELDKVRIEISALTPSKPVKGYEEIVLGRDGMTLEKDGSFAVFLPQVAPGQGWDRATMLSYLSRKAGLSANALARRRKNYDLPGLHLARMRNPLPKIMRFCRNSLF